MIQKFLKKKKKNHRLTIARHSKKTPDKILKTIHPKRAQLVKHFETLLERDRTINHDK